MLNELLSRHGFNFKKSLGQNFLSDKNLLGAICADASVSEIDAVIEIGAGAGTLTAILALRAKCVLAYEIDKNLESVLADSLSDCKNVKIIIADALKTPIGQIEREAEIFSGQKEYKVVANLPYYITTPFIFKFIEEAKFAKSLTFLVQKEVAERLVASPSCGEYGAASVGVQAAGRVKITRTVPRTVFFPPPNVDSAVVHIELDENLYNINCRQTFRKVVRAAFATRRKTLVNNLCAARLASDKTAAAALLEKVGANVNARAENLSVKQFAMLANLIFDFGQT